MDQTMNTNKEIGYTRGGFTVGHHAKMSGCAAVGTITDISEHLDGLRITLTFEEPQPVDVPEGSTARVFSMGWRNITATWRPLATTH